MTEAHPTVRAPISESTLLARRLRTGLVFAAAACGTIVWGVVCYEPWSLVPTALIGLGAYDTFRMALESAAFAADARVRLASTGTTNAATRIIGRSAPFLVCLVVVAVIFLLYSLQGTLFSGLSAFLMTILASRSLLSLQDLFLRGGWAMWPILFFFICSIGVIAERSIYLFGASIDKGVFLATMQKCLVAGDIAKAVEMCSAENAPLARIVQAGLVKVNAPNEEVQAAMDEAALREMPVITKRTPALALFANLAMLCGLFGTIVGLIKAFSSLHGDPSQKARLLAEGISEAMNCTAFGLLAAVTALVGFTFLNGKTQSIEDDINEVSKQVRDFVNAGRELHGPSYSPN